MAAIDYGAAIAPFTKVLKTIVKEILASKLFKYILKMLRVKVILFHKIPEFFVTTRSKVL